jgi:hypothetical protein
MVVAAAALAAAAAAWSFGGLLQGPVLPRALTLAGVLVGAAASAISFRLARAAVMQYAIFPIAFVAGAVAIAPSATGGTSNLFGLVVEAIKGGGLQQPPIPFEPGWRFILVFFFVLLTAGAAETAIGFAKPQIAVILPLPVTFAAILLQPKGNEILVATVAIVLIAASLGVSLGAQLASASAGLSAAFEVRRLGRGLAMLAVLVVGMVLLTRATVLFPDNSKAKVIPPQKPQSGSLEADRVLFTVHSSSPGPWRTGVLDVYDGKSWLLPPADGRNESELSNGRIPGFDAPGPLTESFRIVDMRGRALPVPAGMTQISAVNSPVTYNARTGVPRLDARVSPGTTYTIRARSVPSSPELEKAAQPDANVLASFGEAPPIPANIAALLAKAPANPYDRLTFLRTQLYSSVVAAGSGQPTDVPPERVAQMLKPGAQASPFEISAAEALLARWSGLPSRLGFGYEGGKSIGGGFEVHPANGAAWLEVYFKGQGWVPLVGVPPRAKPSLSKDQKNPSLVAKPTDDSAISIFVPIRRPSVQLLYEIVRYYALLAAPFILGLIVTVVGYPALSKFLRSIRRRRWGASHGLLSRLLVTYAEFRDDCHDLNLGDVRDTPLEFRRWFVQDDEHDEMSWLVTRLMWGDLSRVADFDLIHEGETMIASVRSRIRAEQPYLNRLVGAVARASLRDPYSDEIPTRWLHLRGLSPLQWVRHWRGPARPVRRLAGGMAILGLLGLPGCGTAASAAPATIPAHLVPGPAETLAGVQFKRSPEAEALFRKKGQDNLASSGRVWTINQGGLIQGTVQVAVFPPTTDVADPVVQGQVRDSIQGYFVPYQEGTARFLLQTRPDELVFLRFPPGHNIWEVVVFRRKFTDSEHVLQALLFYERGISTDELPDLTNAPPAGGQLAPPPDIGNITPSVSPTPTP